MPPFARERARSGPPLRILGLPESASRGSQNCTDIFYMAAALDFVGDLMRRATANLTGEMRARHGKGTAGVRSNEATVQKKALSRKPRNCEPTVAVRGPKERDASSCAGPHDAEEPPEGASASRGATYFPEDDLMRRTRRQRADRACSARV